MKRGTKNDGLAEADLQFCWVIALRSEANPVIEAFGMKSLTGGSLFPVYINPDNGHTLVITGIGSTKSAETPAEIEIARPDSKFGCVI